jgi:MFS family permease
MAALLGSHSLVDTYSAFVPALLGVLEVRCHLTLQQSATLLGMGSICSGIAQPLTAWFNDRFDSRASAALGLFGCAACLSSIGSADNYFQLLVLYGLGMFAGGMFHPAAAATVGHLGSKRRSLSISFFFVAGMIGWAFGNVAAPRIAGLAGGMERLMLCMVPGVLAAVVLHAAVRRIPHRQTGHHTVELVPENIGQRWWAVAMLFLAAAIRFSVNMALMYLCVRFVQQSIAADHSAWTAEQLANTGAPLVGNLNAMMIVGMAFGGLLSGVMLPAGREKWPLVVIPILFSPAIFLLPRFGIGAAYLLSSVAGFGFASMVPVSMAVAQRMLPHRTSMASALMLGGAWALAFMGPQFAGWGVVHLGLIPTYACVAAALAISGLVLLPLRSSLISSY